MDALDLMGLPYLFDQCDPGLTEAAGGRYLRFDFVVYYGAAVTVIEFDGEQHERPATFGGITVQQAAEAFERLQESDAIKNEHCAAMGYRLLRIQAADLMRAPRLIGDFFRTRLGWAPGRPLPPDTPAIPRAPAAKKPKGRSLPPERPTADELTRELLANLGASPLTPTTVEPAALVVAPVLDLAKRINAEACRLFDNGGGAHRARVIAGSQGGRQRQAVASSLNVVLRPLGAALMASYDTPRQKRQGKPQRYVVRWTAANTRPD